LIKKYTDDIKKNYGFEVSDVTLLPLVQARKHAKLMHFAKVLLCVSSFLKDIDINNPKSLKKALQDAGMFYTLVLH